MNEKILNCLREGIIIFDEEYMIQFCNKSILEKLHYNADDLEKEHLAKIVFEHMDTIIHETETFLDNILSILLCDRDINPIQVEGRIFEEKWLGKRSYWLVITEYKEKKYSIEELELIIENMPYNIWVVDEKEDYKYINHNASNTFKQLFGKDKNIEGIELLGQSVKEFYKNSIDEITLEKDDQALRKGVIINTGRRIKKGISNIKFHIMKIPMFDKKQIYKGYIGIMQHSILKENVDIAKIIESSRDEVLAEKIIYDKVIKSLEFDKSIVSIFQGKSSLILRYNKKTEDLEGICRLGEESKEFIPARYLQMSGTRVLQMLEENVEWTLEEFEQRVDGGTREDLRRLGIKYIMINLIKYNGEFIGVVLTTYKSKLKYPLMEWCMLDKLCQHVSIILKSMEYSFILKKELLARREVEEKLNIYLSLAVDFTVIINTEGRITKWDHRGEMAMGWNKEEISQISYCSLIQEDDRKIVDSIMNEIRGNKEVIQFVNRFRHKDGTYRWIQWRGRIDEEGKKFYVIARDITTEKRIEKERMAYKEALQLETLKTEFLANISHELKTPLNIIYSMLQLVELELDEAVSRVDLSKLARYRKVSKQNVLRLLRLINNITDISKIGAGYYETKLVNCDIVRIIEDITMSVIDYVH